MARAMNEAGLKILKRYEGCRLKAYRCPAGVWTIGWGHTGGVKQGEVWTQARADAQLIVDIERYCAGVERAVRVKVSDNQFSALASLCYNIGEGALANSTVIRRLNAGDRAGAAAAFAMWRRGGGRVLPGLVERRAQEAALFLKG